MTTNLTIFGITPQFQLGEIVATAHCHQTISERDRLIALNRHASGDWGDICEDDRGLNELSLRDGSRLLSVYKDSKGKTFWIITEADRSVTTLLMPEDY